MAGKEVQSVSPYTQIGEDVVLKFIERPYDRIQYGKYDQGSSSSRNNRCYSRIWYENDSKGKGHWPPADHEDDPEYLWYNAYNFAGGKFNYKIDPDTGDVIFTCDGNHTKPFQYDFINSYEGNWECKYGALQDARYHLSGCPSGGSRDTYFLYLGPYNQRRYDSVYTDMEFNTYPVDTGNGADIDLRDTRYYKNCTIGNYLETGEAISPRTYYTVTETGLHSGYVTPYGPVLSFVIMPGVAVTNLRVARPRLIKTGEAYDKGEDVLGRPTAFSPIDGYSYYENYGLRVTYDWDEDAWKIKGTYKNSIEDQAAIDLDWIYTMPLTAGHKYSFVPPQIVSSNNPLIKMAWNFYIHAVIEEQDPRYATDEYQSGYYTLGYDYPSWNMHPNYPPETPVYENYIDLDITEYETPWGISKQYTTGFYKPLKKSYDFTVKKDKYSGTYYDSSFIQNNNFSIFLDPSLNGMYIDVVVKAPSLLSLSGKEKPKPDPPPPRPEPSKPESDTIWDLGTTFVISPGSYETGLLDNYESLIWNEVYNDVGDFEVYTCVDDDILHICKPGNMITRSDSDKIMIIESVKITTDVESGNHVTVKGRSLESILERRIIWDQTTVSGSVHDAIKKLITDAIIEPKNECRKIDDFIFEDSEDEQVLQYQMDEAQFEGESLLESVKKICDIFHLGFKVNMNSEGKYAFKLYSRTDRSYYQEDRPYVIFSHNFGNLLDSEFITDYYNYKTTMLVMSDVEDDTIKTKRVTIGDGYSGIDRREVSYKSSTSPNKESGGGKYTNEEFARMLNEDGTRQLTEYKVTNQFQGSADIHQMYIYGEDFFLGDVVQIVDEFGNSACSRVNRLVISHDSNGIYSYPEFEIFERGNKLKISTGSMTETNPSINVKFNDSLTTEHFASEYSTEYTPLYDLVGVAYGAVQTKSFNIKSLKRVMLEERFTKLEQFLLLSHLTHSLILK